MTGPQVPGDQNGPNGSQDLENALRRALQHSAPASDYDDLVQSVHRKVGVRRRRRAVGTVVGAAAAVGVFATGGILIADNLTTSELPPASHMNGETERPSDGVPWQDTEPPLPAGGAYESGNAWEIPDPRPTGIAALDALGEPATYSATPGGSPLPVIISCGSGSGEGLSVAGINALYQAESGTGEEIQTVQISVSGWEDGDGGLDRFRADDFPCTWAEGAINERDWTGSGEGLLTDVYETGYGRNAVGALVPVGEYTVGITVEGEDTQLAAETAVEVAEKTADNLRALDPERAGS